MKNVYLGREPIIDSQANLSAYELLYRNAQKKSDVNGNRHASASVINSVLNKFGKRTILGTRRGFIRVDEKFLLNDIILSVPSEFFVFALLPTVPMSERIVERVQQLSESGYVLALNDMPLNEESIEKYSIIFNELSYVKINIESEVSTLLKDMITKIQLNNITIIATMIEDSKTYEIAQELGCDWFQGYFFAQPVILENATYEPMQMNVLKLYNLLMKDGSIDEITAEFENNPEITIQLLQYINSGYFHFRNRIATIHHVLTLVGRIAIAQWLMLMIYSKSATRKAQRSPLMLMVKNRTELMQSILKAVQPNVKSNMLGEAYMVGVLSLVDTIFGVKLEDILKTINISDDVKASLLECKGLLGEIYTQVKCTETFDIESVYNFEKKYELKHKTIENLVLECMQEVQRFETPHMDE
jgi:EAL and modified HD-GYP domain-containing signal transduction protein